MATARRWRPRQGRYGAPGLGWAEGGGAGARSRPDGPASSAQAPGGKLTAACPSRSPRLSKRSRTCGVAAGQVCPGSPPPGNGKRNVACARGQAGERVPGEFVVLLACGPHFWRNQNVKAISASSPFFPPPLIPPHPNYRSALELLFLLTPLLHSAAETPVLLQEMGDADEMELGPGLQRGESV